MKGEQKPSLAVNVLFYIDTTEGRAYFLSIQDNKRRGVKNMAEEFACVACGEHAEKDDVLAVQECRICRRMHCDGCLNEEGLCVECSD